MAVVIIASFVPAFARAESEQERQITKAQSAVNALSLEKDHRCTGNDRAECKIAYDEVIEAVRSYKSKLVALEAVRFEVGSEFSRLEQEMIKDRTDGFNKVQSLYQRFPLPVTVGSKN
ncbi:MAG: hypothetical protein JWM46_149 [Candidatus Kaiserbacteria bacterium]|nr:hypothetical protein [Candidatus Kaiserbacteria bacterium]